MNKAFLGVKILIIAGIALFASAQSAFAYRGEPNVPGPNYSPERHEAMLKAFEKKDYNAWKNLMQGRGRVTEIINANNFARFAEMHKLRLEGKIEEANKIRAELGLGLRNGAGKNQNSGYNRWSR